MPKLKLAHSFWLANFNVPYIDLLYSIVLLQSRDLLGVGPVILISIESIQNILGRWPSPSSLPQQQTCLHP